jgi:membrane protein DedA with SNARE-associated domain
MNDMKISWRRQGMPLLLALALGLGLACHCSADTTAYPSSGALQGEIETEMSRAVARAAPLLERYGYAALFAAILLEGMGIPAPGQTLMIGASLAAARGGLSIGWVLAWAFVAAVAGNCAGYLIGLKGGRPLLVRLGVSEERLEKTQRRFSRTGAGIILVARFVDGLRQINGIAAGLLRMPPGTFMAANVPGAILWVGFWGLGTFFLEKEIAAVHVSLRQAEPWAWGITLAALGLLLARMFRWKRNHGHR